MWSEFCVTSPSPSEWLWRCLKVIRGDSKNTDNASILRLELQIHTFHYVKALTARLRTYLGWLLQSAHKWAEHWTSCALIRTKFVGWTGLRYAQPWHWSCLGHVASKRKDFVCDSVKDWSWDSAMLWHLCGSNVLLHAENILFSFADTCKKHLRFCMLTFADFWKSTSLYLTSLQELSKYDNTSKRNHALGQSSVHRQPHSNKHSRSETWHHPVHVRCEAAEELEALQGNVETA